MFAYVPARGGSKRIPRKNVRPLGGKPLLLHVLDHLARVPGLSGIGVSSEDPEVLALADAHPAGKTLGPRASALADDATGFLDLAVRDAPRFARAFGDEDVLFVTPTAALVPPQAYAEALRRFKPGALVMAVAPYAQSPMLALSGRPEDGLVPLFPDMYLKPTRELPACFADSGCFYGFRLSTLAGKAKFIDLSPILGVALPPDVGIDLDTEADWSRLEAAYARSGHGVAPKTT